MPDPAGRAADKPAARSADDPSNGRSASRPGTESAGDGWGSPVPAEYGSLRASRAPRSSHASPASVARSSRSSSTAASPLAALMRRIQGVGSPRGKGSRNGAGQRSRNGTAAQGAIAGKAAAASSSVATAAAAAGSSVAGAAAAAGSSVAGAAAAAGSSVAGAASAATASVRSLLAPSSESPPSAETATLSPMTGAAAPAELIPGLGGSEPPLSAAPGVVPTAGLPPGPAPALPPVRPTRRERREIAMLTAQRARSRATVRHIDIWTVIKVSVVFYLIVAIVIVAASLLLWYAADAFGTLPSLEKSIRTLFGLKSFKIHPGAVLGYTTLAGLVLTVAGAIANVLAALVYNLISDAVGGIRVELEAPRRRPE